MAIHTQTKKPKKQKNKKPKNKKKKTKKTKNQKKKKNKKTRPNTLHLTPSPWGVQSWFFWFSWFFGFWVFCFFGFLVCVWIAQTLPMGLNFSFLCSRGFWPKNCKKPWKNKKKTKSSDPCPLPGLSQTLPMGLNLFFFLFFPLLFWMFFMWRCFHHSTSQKNARLYNLHTCAPQAKLQKKNNGKTKIH